MSRQVLARLVVVALLALVVASPVRAEPPDYGTAQGIRRAVLASYELAGVQTPTPTATATPSPTDSRAVEIDSNQMIEEEDVQ
jgi:hypothetical protein